MEPAHILFLTDVLYGTHGGAEGVLSKMIRALPVSRFRCSIATFATFADLVAADRFSCPVHRFPLSRTYDWNAVRTAFRLARLIRGERISIVHAFFAVSDLFGGAIAKLSGCPILISSRRDMGFQRTRIQRLAYRLAADWYDQVHAVSEQVRHHHIEQDRLAPEKVITVHNGVDLAAIDAAPRLESLRNLGVESAERIVACVANIRPIKGIDVMLNSAAIVCAERPGTRFVIVGGVQDAEYMRELSAIMSRLNLAGKVIFAGQHANIPSILKACDTFFLPSRSEGLSNALLEAMACALPVVATAVGGNPEVVAHGQSGCLFPSGDAVAGARHLLTLLEDPGAARRMGDTGRRIVENRFTAEGMMRKLIGLYEDLLARRVAGTGEGERSCGRKYAPDEPVLQ